MIRLRRVERSDEPFLSELNADARVMAPLGGVLTPEQTRAWLDKLLEHWRKHDYGRFIVEKDGAPIGIVGLSRTDFDAGIVPGVEIAWRLAPAHWGHGYATEAARLVLDDARERLNLTDIIAVTTVGNTRSRAVMERLGMTLSPSETFEHPNVPPGPLRTHVVYRARSSAGRAR